jgi:hypothetical protein
VSLRQILRRKKREYLLLVAEAGGDKHAFTSHIAIDYHTHPTDYEMDAAILEAAVAVWNENRKPGGGDDDEQDLFSIAGYLLPETLTYPDPSKPANQGESQSYRKIAIEFATVQHLADDAQVTIEAGNRIVEAGKDKLRIAREALLRAKGDPSMLLLNIIDGK